MVNLRVGHGFDVHRFVEHRDLIIGGVKIPFHLGLEGVSDADVLLHAIMDALLGAAGLPDIGVHFPPDDIKYKNADSALLLQQVDNKIKTIGYKIINIDATIMVENPKMNPHILKMKEKIATILTINQTQINIKATTTEKLGFVGRQEGIAAMAVCLISKDG
ncbi:MAG: 2-C-methyl-D-erythritol 2,4-cyclodiphosphate synthase [Candidatus Zixiibacteriota bacterium]